MYEVYLDDIFFYGVTSVNYPSDRKITVYNGIGTGYFPKADDPNLKKWSWDCELQEFPEHYHGDFAAASAIRSKLDSLLASKEPSRMVIKSDYTSVSEQVYLEGYDCREIYAGVYEFSVNVTEYKEAAVRTTNIPEIPRPGKIPETPPFSLDGDVYDKVPAAEESWDGIGPDKDGTIHKYPGATGPSQDGKIHDLNGNVVNPNNEVINNITGELVTAPEFEWGNFWNSVGNVLFPYYEDSALNQMVKGFEEYESKNQVVSSVNGFTVTTKR